MKRYSLLSASFLLATIATLALTLPTVRAQGRKSDPEKFWRSPPGIHGKTVVVPTGSHIEGRINETIGSRTQPGQKFSIEITSPVLANSTDVIIPSGSRIIGEVVEAIPSGKQRRIKGMPKPLGKLRTQLSVLMTPDGMSYPLVASIMAEYISSGKGNKRDNPEFGNPSMGYVGSQASFDAVHPGFDTRGTSGSRGPKVVGRRQFMRDPILGNDGQMKFARHGTQIIRSIQRHGNEIFIFSGSPLTVRLDAPLKIGIAPSKGSLSIDLDPVTPSLEEGSDGSFRRFKPAGKKDSQANDEKGGTPPPEVKSPLTQPPPEPDQDEGLPAFLRRPKKSFEDNSFTQPQQSPGDQQPEPTEAQGQDAQSQQPQGIPLQPSQKPGEAF